MEVSVRKFLLGSAGAVLVALAVQGSALAQVTLSNLLGTVNVNATLKGAAGSAGGTCSRIEIELNRPVNVLDSIPAEKGMDIFLHVEPLGTEQSTDSTAIRKEAATVPPQNPAGLGLVAYDPVGPHGREIHISFAKTMAYKLRRDENNRHIVLDVASPGASTSCLGFKASDMGEGAKGDAEVSSNDAGGGTDEAANALAEGKKILAAGDFSKAGAFFTKANNLGTGKVKQEALEMLGLAHERAGQLPMAQSDYEAYLKAYPGGPETVRVEQRLRGVVAAMGDESNRKFANRKTDLESKSQATGQTTSGSAKGDADVSGVSLGPAKNVGGMTIAQLGLKTDQNLPPKDPKAWTFTKNGSIAQYYYRDDNFAPTTPGGSAFSNHLIFQNQILSSADAYARFENEDYDFEIHGTAFNQVDGQHIEQASNLSVSTVYLEGKMKQENLDLRVGRESTSFGGVFGRFDGGIATWGADKGFKMRVVGGAPVLSRDVMPFSDNRWLASGSLEYTSFNRDWSAAIYAIEQNVGDIVDRRALGSEARWSNEHFSVYSAADYDFFFHTLNNAYASGTWLPRQGMSIYATLDYRRTPFLATSNALSGQPAIGSLQELSQSLGIDLLTQCAIDRTATAETASAGISNQFSEKWAASVDVSVFQYLGTPASLACVMNNPLGNAQDFFTPDSGLNVYGSATISGNSLLKQNDTLTTSLRLAYSPQSWTYGADSSYRYPINDKLRLLARAQLNFRRSMMSDQIQYLISGTFGASYRLNDHWSFESEAGLRYLNSVVCRHQPALTRFHRHGWIPLRIRLNQTS